MNILHGKSPCCQAKIYKFGGKRKQCSLCKKTWSVRKKKRGRKAKRINPDLLNKVLGKGWKVAHLADRKGSVSQSAFSQRLKKAMSAKTRTNKYPIGWLILIALAPWFGLEFLRRLPEFRAYLKYPDLHLPPTTGCLESFNKIIRDRCKYVRTPEALRLRVISLTRIRTSITCNHVNFQQN